MKIENEKKEEKWEKQKKRKTLGKTSTMIYFSRIKWCHKKRGDTEFECDAGVKHNSKFKTIHFRKLTLICWRKRKSTKGIEKTKWTLQYEGSCVFEKVENTKWEMRKETKKDTKQFEQDGKWNKKKCVGKIKTRGKRKTQRE